jgi:hypothetical protein
MPERSAGVRLTRGARAAVRGGSRIAALLELALDQALVIEERRGVVRSQDDVERLAAALVVLSRRHAYGGSGTAIAAVLRDAVEGTTLAVSAAGLSGPDWRESAHAVLGRRHPRMFVTRPHG